jgi:hypothetical protein
MLAVSQWVSFCLHYMFIASRNTNGSELAVFYYHRSFDCTRVQISKRSVTIKDIKNRGHPA